MNRDEQLRAELGELLWTLIDYLEHTEAPIEMALGEVLTQIRAFRERAGILRARAAPDAFDLAARR